MRYALVRLQPPHAGLFAMYYDMPDEQPDVPTDVLADLASGAYRPDIGPMQAIASPPEEVGEGWWYDGEVWAQATPDGAGGWTLPTAAERLEMARSAKIAALRAERIVHENSLYDPSVVLDASLGIPTPGFVSKIESDRRQGKMDLDVALAAVASATTIEEINAVTVSWTVTQGADPDAPEYQQ